MRAHNSQRLAALKTDLTVKLAALKGVSDERISSQHAAREQAASAVQLCGIRQWDGRRPVADLVAQLETDRDAMADDPRRVDTVRKIDAALRQARGAIAARNHADAMGRHQSALEAEIAPLQRLVTACDAWLAEAA